MTPRRALRPMMADVGYAAARRAPAGDNLLFEGAQGTLLDVDHGTYPYVTSSNCVAGNAAAGAGVGPDMLHYILGITKAYTHARRRRPVPDRAADRRAGHRRPPPVDASAQERGTVTGRARRCGWLDAALLKRSMHDQRHLGPVHHQARRARRPAGDQALRRLRARRPSASTSCRSAPTRSRAACRCTRRCRAGRESTFGVTHATRCR